MFTLDVTERAEQEILKTLDNYVPQAPSYDKLVGIWLHLDDDEKPKVEYIHHFLGAQNHICGKSLTVGVNLMGGILSEFDDTVIDWNGQEFEVHKTS